MYVCALTGNVGICFLKLLAYCSSLFCSHPSDTTYLSHAIRTPNPNLSSGAGAVAAANALLSNVSVSCVRFCPYEDILCAGHSHGLTSIVVPGAGEPNYDSFENDPFMNSRQRRENEVQTLLSKLSHEMIGLGMYCLIVECNNLSSYMQMHLYFSQMPPSLEQLKRTPQLWRRNTRNSSRRRTRGT